ncbi:hypothetical protein AX16_006960 [Volvariella volvacea WC 439]|nr:hypothetical protein AX16_006960 [Volvariella volvacea WC 439]
MASPKVLIQIAITGTRILGKAFLEAGRQAVKNAKNSPQGALGNDVAGVGNANSGSITDKLTREHRMTLDEAHLILNTKNGDPMEQILKNYEHLFKANSPPPPPAKPAAPTRGRHAFVPQNSHYLQSKVVRARERLEAELNASEGAAAEAPSSSASTTASPPPSQ